MRLALLTAAVLTLLVLRPGLVSTSLRTPLVWLVVGGVVALAVGLRAALQRAGAPAAAVRWAGPGVGLVAVALLLLPSFQQRTLVEVLPMSRAAGPEQAPVSPVDEAPAAAPAPAPVPDRAGEVFGIDHSASGRASLQVLDGQPHLVFEDLDVEGTVGPSVHLVAAGERTPTATSRVGELKAERGTFSYALPEPVPDGAWTVLIWCDPFDVPIAAADLG